MARELGFKPQSLLKNISSPQQPSKAPVWNRVKTRLIMPWIC